MARYLGNAFSLNMVKPEHLEALRFVNCPIEEVKEWMGVYEWESCVGHTDTATLLTTLLGTDVGQRRTTITLEKSDTMMVAQYKGPRLDEDATVLPDGAMIEWVFVYFVNR